MFKKIFTIILLTVIILPSIAQSRMDVLNPEYWYRNSGEITEAEIHITPKGTFMECEVYMSVSDNDFKEFFEDRYYYDDVNVDDTTQLEVDYSFTLPPNSVVHDSWLWVDDSIIVADHIDSWTATSVYEGIVQRRKDPSLLTQTGENSYNIKIYPLFINKTRKIKMSFLIPIHFNNTQAYSYIPIEMFKGNFSLPDSIKCVINESTRYTTPTLTGVNSTLVKNGNNQYTTNISFKEPQQNYGRVIFNQTNKAPYYAGTYSKNGENYLELVLFPWMLLEEKQNTKKENTIFIIDNYHISYSNDYSYIIDKKEVVEAIKEHSTEFIENDLKMNLVHFTQNPEINKHWVEKENIKNFLESVDFSENESGKSFILLKEAIKF